MSPTAVGPISDIPREDILVHLKQILGDRRFASAERMAAFLRYVVDRTLDGKSDEIKETVIATDVYGRSNHYDPKTDSIVRVEASRLRQKLRSYYENEGRSASMRIQLPPGSYVPRFEAVEGQCVQGGPVVTQPAAPEAFPVPEPRRQTPRTMLICAAVAVGTAAIAAVGAARASRTSEIPRPAAVAAVAESIELLEQDPHSAATQRGAPSTVVRAIERLEFAVAKDPSFAQAWAKLAEAYDYAFPYIGRDAGEDATRAEAAARRAVELDHDLSEAHHMLGLVLWGMRWDYPAAEVSYRRALELDPANVYAAIEYADLLRTTGRSRQAADVVRSARALQPGLSQLAAKEAEIHLDLGRVNAAVAAANQALELRRDYLRAYVTLAMAEDVKGELESALSRYEYVLAFDPLERRALPAYGFLLGRMGKIDEAKQIAERLKQMNATIRNCAYQVAVVYAGMGDDELAISWLEQAWRSHQTLFPSLRVDRRFRHLNTNPRFRQLLRRADIAAGM